MPSKLEQVAAMLAGLDKYELESTICLARQEINTRPATGCKSLDVPAEIRNIIYDLVATSYLHRWGSYYDDQDRCGLFSANKQIRIEFMDMCYSKSKVTDKIWFASANFSRRYGYLEVDKMSWKTVESPKFKKLLLDGGPCVTTASAGWQKQEDLQQWVRWLHEDEQVQLTKGTLSQDDASIFGIFEATGFHGDENSTKYASFSVMKRAIKAKGLEDELPVFDDGIKLI
ncbi:hypothetical protein PRZ48_002752 [Zasmidium cellare]|uniref:Uncharacterized protein n=1 Tax=Zasmidium cellare TaxID=395010 RepID=A0ABR0EU44_ZASCE|nr:hypothetical protein PRZ48_002752 [Zasmidium cellare]